MGKGTEWSKDERIQEYNRTFAKKLRYYLDRSGMNQLDLAKRLHVSPQSVTNWINAIKTPRVDKVDAMCDIFGCRASDFAEGIVDHNAEYREGFIPVYGSVCAGDGIFADDRIEEWIDTGAKRFLYSTHFALRIKGNSMEPKFFDGDTVIVRKQETAENGDVVIALVNGDEGVCKRFKQYNGGVALVSDNPSYEPKYFSEEEITGIPVRILGKVERLIRDI